MSIDLLKFLIESACKDNRLDDNERKHIEKYAIEIGVTQENLDFLIHNYLKTSSPYTPSSEKIENQSGFSPIDSQNSSGFITENLEQSAPTQGFSDVLKLSTAGTMSDIYKAKYLGKWVIIKRLKSENNNNPVFIDLLLKEFENSYHLDHPHIVRTLGKGNDNQGIYYFMDFVDGKNLSQMIENNGIKDGKLLKKIALEILDALDYVHKKQIFHRDLKPDNIMITHKGDNTKLIDFGLAAADGFQDLIGKAGTPRYASPEQMQDSSLVDSRSDIFSFGLIFREMISGNKDNAEAIKQRGGMSLFLIVAKCTDISQNKRFASCKEIADLIEKIDIPDALSTNKISDNFNVEIKTESTVLPILNEKITLEIFFEKTHKAWQTEIGENLKNIYSQYANFPILAQKNNPQQLIKLFGSVLLPDIFEKHIFSSHEILLRNNQINIVITNLRLFLKKSDNSIIEFKFETSEFKSIALDLLYVQFEGIKILKSDWELLQKAIKYFKTNES